MRYSTARTRKIFGHYQQRVSQYLHLKAPQQHLFYEKSPINQTLWWCTCYECLRVQFSDYEQEHQAQSHYKINCRFLCFKEKRHSRVYRKKYARFRKFQRNEIKDDYVQVLRISWGSNSQGQLVAFCSQYFPNPKKNYLRKSNQIILLQKLYEDKT